MTTKKNVALRLAALLMLAAQLLGCAGQPDGLPAAEQPDEPVLGSSTSALTEMEARAEWTAIGGTVGQPILAAQSFALRNNYTNRYLRYESQRWGINLGYTANPVYEIRLDRVANRQPSRDGQPIRYGEKVTLWVFRHGYVSYHSRTSGINLGWDRVPNAQWIVDGGNVGEPVRYGQAFGLRNDHNSDYIVWCQRTWGSNIKWHNDCDYRTEAERRNASRRVETSISMLRGTTALGPIWYAGRLGGFNGGINNLRITFPPAYPAVKLLKYGYSSNFDCNDSNKYVVVSGEMTAAQRIAVWNRDVTSLASQEILPFVGCSTATSYVPEWLPISVSFSTIGSGNLREDEGSSLLPVEDEDVRVDEALDDVSCSESDDCSDLEDEEVLEDETHDDLCKGENCDADPVPEKPTKPGKGPIQCVRAPCEGSGDPLPGDGESF